MQAKRKPSLPQTASGRPTTTFLMTPGGQACMNGRLATGSPADKLNMATAQASPLPATKTGKRGATTQQQHGRQRQRWLRHLAYSY